ncbi:B3 domain-containing protein Os12g0592300-like isoform X2 [Asparagus officinalis]|uniref:B3 domain-containing protein Os12g0592300-like isoform X2 n=1 Tax=Asparagus officinalis TaxID=4686 RepID=UPI00098E5BD8|nr:B3 domain-containing protein Os12g0592300-like isoform X2 [Asparagus officinalis]
MEDCEICISYKEHCYWKHQGLKGKQFYEKIPKKFSDHFKSELSQNVILRSPSGTIWSVELAKTSDEISFQVGWDEFVKDNHIQEGDFVIFKYNGNSCFKFSIFKRDHCERASSSVLKKGNLETGRKSDDSVEYLDIKSHNEVMVISSDNSRPSSSFSGQNCRAPRNYQRAGVSYNQKITRSNSTHQKKNLGQSCRMKYIKQESDDIISREMFSRRNIYFPRKRLSGADENKALMLAKSVQSRNPCFVSVMHPYSVLGSGKTFIIPSSFAANHLPRRSMQVSLGIPGHRKKWQVSYIVGNSTSWFGGKWNTFAHDSRLQNGDVCLFELVKKRGNFTMEVHIARAASSSIC